MKEIIYKDLGYAELYCFENYIISQVKEGTIISPDKNKDLDEVIQEHYENRPVVYLSNRTFDYNVMPTTYLESAMIENLIGVGIITQTGINKRNAEFESSFFKKEFIVLDSLLDGILWAENLVKEYSIKKLK
ncbi:hypothetical protein JCM19294_949 [Nonlabens tegetincola]|uniref:Uncharacterized protein n=1 Tax=Nonlabens tegetincola TaxID=323273 RepID=A0A090Q5L8_9FLAO|nr:MULTISPECIES: hypothetical protein [Nonlabens]ALM21840.1 hypothetical protein AAT17_11635 [Nonlabens sp. MIC269]ARN71427.1 hypothetical protein BST91_07130 [Nonlabens tegetincola]PQJ13935.1 hypothetical protein BST93_11765 [Nonlabens tegetincola]GAK98315.1 hypothetical protein JCM19294_949 [Nonlabens tegetincola]